MAWLPDIKVFSLLWLVSKSRKVIFKGIPDDHVSKALDGGMDILPCRLL